MSARAWSTATSATRASTSHRRVRVPFQSDAGAHHHVRADEQNRSVRRAAGQAVPDHLAGRRTSSSTTRRVADVAVLQARADKHHPRYLCATRAVALVQRDRSPGRPEETHAPRSTGHALLQRRDKVRDQRIAWWASVCLEIVLAVRSAPPRSHKSVRQVCVGGLWLDVLVLLTRQ